MSVEHDPAAAYDDLNVRSIALVGGVGAVLVFVAIVAVQVMYFRYHESEYQNKVLAVPTLQANQTLAGQRERLDQAGEGAAEGEKSIPIGEAMASIVAEYRQRQKSDRDAGEGDSEPAQGEQANTKTDTAAEQPASE